VDDDQGVRGTLEEGLMEFGFDVLSAGTGVEALTLLRHAPRPHAILVDLSMPEMSGAELLMHLSRDPHLAHTAVVIITGMPNPPRRASVPLVQKPFVLADLRTTIEEAIRSATKGR
jgi:CheY-like chemotaxis protein